MRRSAVLSLPLQLGFTAQRKQEKYNTFAVMNKLCKDFPQCE
jgi:hypothetical protein